METETEKDSPYGRRKSMEDIKIILEKTNVGYSNVEMDGLTVRVRGEV